MYAHHHPFLLFPLLTILEQSSTNEARARRGGWGGRGRLCVCRSLINRKRKAPPPSFGKATPHRSALIPLSKVLCLLPVTPSARMLLLHLTGPLACKYRACCQLVSTIVCETAKTGMYGVQYMIFVLTSPNWIPRWQE